MPRIILKHKSPEYADGIVKQHVKECDMPECKSDGEHKAPKHRGLDEYFIFCTDHIREYNKAWDFFSGMSEKDIEDHIINSSHGHRPTWRYNTDNINEEALFRAAQKTYFYDDKANSNQEPPRQDSFFNNSGPEFEALAIMGLEPPVTFDEVKSRYKVLAKKHHPDLNKNDKSSEELLKKVNMAYTILKMAFEEYKNLPDTKV